MTLKLKGSRLESEVDKCRTECNWRRLGELLPAVHVKHSGLEKLGDVLEAEYIIETFVERHSECIEPKKEYSKELQKAKTLLTKAIESELSAKQPYNFEMNILLAKLHYYCADYDSVMMDIDRSRLEASARSFHTLRALRLAAEAYAVKGFSIEATMNALDRGQLEKAKMRALFYFENSAYLTISYIQERDKLLNANPRSSSNTLLSLQAGGIGTKQSSEKMGELLESSLERVPVLNLRKSFCDGPPDLKGIEWYRHIMTSLCDKSIGEKLQQRLSRQLAEVLIQRAPDYMPSKSVDTKSQNMSFYADSDGSYFKPVSRIEEVLLLLLISEVLATRDVVLSRAEELSASRHQSVQTAKAVYNLLTLVLSTLRQYELLASIYERAMKFVNQDRYIWFQFALTLMCHGRWVRASRILQQCMAIERHDENALVEHVLAARVEIEHLGQYDEAISHAEKAIELSKGDWLSGRCHLLRAIAFSLKADSEVRHKVRKEMYAEAITWFEKAVILDPHDELAHYYYARQCAIVRDLRSAREQCDRALELNSEFPSALMLLALIITATKDYEAALDFVADALISFPTNFALLVLRLKLETKLGHTSEALETSRDLLFFWRTTEISTANEVLSSHFSDSASKSNVREVRSSVARSMSSRDAFIPLVPVLTAPMGIIAPAPVVTPLASQINGDTEGGSIFGGGLTIAPEIGAGASTVSEGITSGSSVSTSVFARFRTQANIWVELAEMFIEMERIDDVRICVDEACSVFPNSYQSLYLKGRLLTLRAGKETDEKIKSQLHSEAKVCLLGALALSPSHIASLKHLAGIYHSEGNILMAEKMLKDILQIDPLHSDSWQLLGIVLSEAGRYEEGLECLSTAARLDVSTPLIPFTSIPLAFHSF